MKKYLLFSFITLFYQDIGFTMQSVQPSRSEPGGVVGTTYDYIKNYFNQFNKKTSLADKSKFVEVRHETDPYKNGSIEKIKKYGLLTYQELFNRGLTNTNPSQFKHTWPDQYNVIYFSHDNPNSEKTVTLSVNPDDTYVYNRQYRFKRDLSKYSASKILLAKYIANKKKAEEMRLNAPKNVKVMLDPITSEPHYVKNNDPRYFSKDYFYYDEILIPRTNIPPEELIFP